MNPKIQQKVSHNRLNKHRSIAGSLIFLSLLVAVVDQATKYFLAGESPVTNDGILFGLLPGSNEIMIGASIAAALILVVVILFSHARGKVLYAVILGGIIGNLADRIMHGHVIDFIKVGNFPVFNVADAAISVSVVLLIIYSLWAGKIYRMNRDRLMSRLKH